MAPNRVLGIAGAAILFGGGLVALLYFADRSGSGSLHLALSVAAGMVAMSGIIVINGLLSLGELSQLGAGRYPEIPSHDTEVEKDTGQVTQSFGQRQAQNMQRQQESRQQEEVSAQLSRHA